MKIGVARGFESLKRLVRITPRQMKDFVGRRAVDREPSRQVEAAVGRQIVVRIRLTTQLVVLILIETGSGARGSSRDQFRTRKNHSRD